MKKDFFNHMKGFYAIIDTTYVSPGDIGEVTGEILSGGARVLQLRAKGSGSGEMLKMARVIRRLTGDKDAFFIVNDRVDIAMIAGADGVHLGLDDIPVEEARRLLGPGAVIGLSTHNLAEAIEAASTTADYISFGPVFTTRTKKDAGPVTGLAALKRVTGSVQKPVVAIGGISEETFDRVLETGATAAAVISHILGGGDIRKKVSSIIAGSRKKLSRH
ncbi:MAG: thiamine phosphate synthase [Thermodesulfobacteriota bacterium]|nr:MAG: thiamine phosphate synthase [Thermodesulfobacteriota bacterium]